MTHPTKAIYFNLLTDFAKLSAQNAEAPLFDKKDVEATMERIEVVDFDQTIDVNGIKVKAQLGRGGYEGATASWHPSTVLLSLLVFLRISEYLHTIEPMNVSFFFVFVMMCDINLALLVGKACGTAKYESRPVSLAVAVFLLSADHAISCRSCVGCCHVYG